MLESMREGSTMNLAEMLAERRNAERLRLERIRALDPTLLECGPECAHYERHVSS
jgi:hypothetical protein